MLKREKLRKSQFNDLTMLIKNKESSPKEIKRAQAVILVDQEANPETIKQLTGYSRKHSFHLRKVFLNEGIEGLKDKRRKKFEALLTKGQREEIIHVITTQTPKDYGHKSDVWTTAILGELIKYSYGVIYKSKTSYHLLFQEAKFTYHKPGRIYKNRDEEEVEVWKRETKPLIEKAWLDDNIVILAEDEMILSTQTTFQKIWLPVGSYPKIEVSNTRENRSLYGFLNVKTGQNHVFKTERQNMYITRDILKKVRSIYPGKKILLFWDNAGWHRGSIVQEFIKEDKNIEVVYFPKYSPEENPQEHVWKKGRSQVTHNAFIENIDKATDEFVAYLNNTVCNYSLLGFSAK